GRKRGATRSSSITPWVAPKTPYISRTENALRAKLDSQSFLDVTYAVSRHTNLGLLLVLEPEQHPAVHVRIELFDERDVHDRAAMGPDESASVEALLELRQRVVDDV